MVLPRSRNWCWWSDTRGGALERARADSAFRVARGDPMIGKPNMLHCAGGASFPSSSAINRTSIIESDVHFSPGSCFSWREATLVPRRDRTLTSTHGRRPTPSGPEGALSSRC